MKKKYPKRTIPRTRGKQIKLGLTPVSMRKYKRCAAHILMAKQGIPHVNRETSATGEKRRSYFARNWRSVA